MNRQRRPRSFPKKKLLAVTAIVLGLLTLAASLALLLRTSAPASPRFEGTARMAARLAAILKQQETVSSADTESAATNPWLVNRPQMAGVYSNELLRTTAIPKILELRMKIGRELLWDGKPAQALEQFLAAETLLYQAEESMPAGLKARVLSDLGRWVPIAYLRLGEVENCIQHHNIDSCLMPIQGSGIHRSQRGSQSAIAALANVLQAQPDDLGSRWLLNIAYMTVGGYPDAVPKPWLIPPEAFASEHDVKRFRDVAPAAGVAMLGLAGGCIVEDMDRDGSLDILASSWSLKEQLRFFRNRGDGNFDDATEAAGLLGETGGLNMSHADYDNDGYPDVLVRRGGWLQDGGLQPSSLLRNRGDGTFDDVTEEARISSVHPGQVAVWADYDNDGWVDVFFGNEMDSKSQDHPSQLFRNNGDGTFTECAGAVGITTKGYIKGAAWGDVDNDGLQDLYVSRLGDPNVLYRNGGRAAGAWRFADVTAKAGVSEPIFSFPTWFFDADNDGWLDLFVAGFNKITVADVAASYLKLPSQGETPRLYRNLQNGTFKDVTREVRLDRVFLVMGSNFGDLDNDGYPDIYAGTGAPDLRTLMPNRMFRNAEGKVFQDVTTSGGFGHLQKGHGIAFADFDDDGDQDVYAVMGGWYSGDGFHNVLFENPGHGNHWVTIRLEGTTSNRAAIGARIKVTVAEGGVRRDIHAVAGTGGSFGSSSLQQEIGLGQAASIEAIEIRWPATGKVQVFRGVPMDRIVKVREGDAEAALVPSKPARLGGGAASGAGSEGSEGRSP